MLGVAVVFVATPAFLHTGTDDRAALVASGDGVYVCRDRGCHVSHMFHPDTVSFWAPSQPDVLRREEGTRNKKGKKMTPPKKGQADVL